MSWSLLVLYLENGPNAPRLPALSPSLSGPPELQRKEQVPFINGDKEKGKRKMEVHR